MKESRDSTNTPSSGSNSLISTNQTTPTSPLASRKKLSIHAIQRFRKKKQKPHFRSSTLPNFSLKPPICTDNAVTPLPYVLRSPFDSPLEHKQTAKEEEPLTTSALVLQAVAVTTLFSLASFINVLRVRPEETWQSKEQDSCTCTAKPYASTDLRGFGYFAVAVSVGIAGLSHLALRPPSWASCNSKYILVNAKTVFHVFAVVSLVGLLPCARSIGIWKSQDNHEHSACQIKYIVVCAVHVAAFFFLDFLQRLLNVQEREKREILSNIKDKEEASHRDREASFAKRVELKALFAKAITGEIRYTVDMAADTIRSYVPSALQITERIPSLALPMSTVSIFAIQTALQNIEHLSYHLDSINRLLFTVSTIPTEDTTHKVQPNSVAFDVGVLLQSVGDAMAGTAALANIELVMYHHPDAAPGNLMIRGDKGGFRHVLVNLLSTICSSASSGSSIELGVNAVDDTDSATTAVYDAKCRVEMIHTPPTKKEERNINDTLRETEGDEVKQVPDANATAKLVNSIGGSLTAREVDGRFVFEVIVPVNSVTAKDAGENHMNSSYGALKENSRYLMPFPNEPSAAELRAFILELRCKKVFLHAKVHSTSAKHFTSTLTSWGADIVHLPITAEKKSPPEELPLPNHLEGPLTSPTSEAHGDHDDNYGQRTDASFIVIDDDIPTLKEKIKMLLDLSCLPPQSTSPQYVSDPTSEPIDLGMGISTLNNTVQSPRIIPALIHFTSVSHYQLAREAIEDALSSRTQPSPSSPHGRHQNMGPTSASHTAAHSTSSQQYASPPIKILSREKLTSFVASRIFLVLKPSGSHRFLVALYNASRLPINPSFESPQVPTAPCDTTIPESGTTSDMKINLTDKASSSMKLPPASIPMVTTPGGTAILFEPIPGVSRESIRQGVKSMRARLVMPMQSNGSRTMGDTTMQDIETMNWVMRGQNPRPATTSLIEKSTTDNPPSYFPTFNSGGSTVPGRVTPSSTPGQYHMTADKKYRSYGIPGIFGSNGTGMSSSSSSSSVVGETHTIHHHGVGASTGTKTSPLAYERPIAMVDLIDDVQSKGELSPRTMPDSSTTATDVSGIPVVGSGTAAAAAAVETSGAASDIIPPGVAAAESRIAVVPSATKKRAIVSNLASPVEDPRKARGAGALSALFGERNLTPPINVLIVEDNPINQTILSTFLRKRKIEYSVASNGQEAVDKWSMGGFHLVLMDIQLPVMDGIQATKEIRRMEKALKIGFVTPQISKDGFADDCGERSTSKRNFNLKNGSSDMKNKDKFSIPAMSNVVTTALRSPVIIVALTASSLQSDRHAALAAGCNDFLTKPVSLVWLEKKIMEWGCMQALIDFEGWKKWKSGAGSNAGSSSPSDKERNARPKSGGSSSTITTATTKTQVRGAITKKAQTSISNPSSPIDVGVVVESTSPLTSKETSVPIPVPTSILKSETESTTPSEPHLPATILQSGEPTTTTHDHQDNDGTLKFAEAVAQHAINGSSTTTTTTIPAQTLSPDISTERERRKRKYLGCGSRSASFSSFDPHPPQVSSVHPRPPPRPPLPSITNAEHYLDDPGDVASSYRQDRGENSPRR